jgi:hypothetical protein
MQSPTCGPARQHLKPQKPIRPLMLRPDSAMDCSQTRVAVASVFPPFPTDFWQFLFIRLCGRTEPSTLGGGSI